MEIILSISSFLSAFMLSAGVMRALAAGNDYMARLVKFIGSDGEAGMERKEAKRTKGTVILREAILKSMGKIRLLDGYKQKVRNSLSRAHLPLKAEELITFSFMLFCIFFFSVIASGGTAVLPAAFVAGAAGWWVPSFAVKRIIRKRVRLINEQLGDAITMLSNSMKAGNSFFQAVDMVSAELSGPVAEEFSIMKKEINLGLDTDKALENMAARVLSDDMDILVTAVMIQRQAGGNLSELLDNIAETIRDRVKIKRELKTITAQGRISGLVISLLPFILYGILYMINPSQMGLLIARPLGRVMAGFALAMEAIGIALIRKIVRIEF